MSGIIRRVRIRTLPQPRSIRLFASLAAALTLLLGLSAVPTSAATPTAGLFSDTLAPKVQATTDTRSVNLGMKFSSDRNGSVVAVQFHRSPQQTKAYTASLWDLDGTLLSQTTFPASTTPGWQTAELPSPVSLSKGRWYVVSYLASDGRHSLTEDVFTSNISNDGLNGRKWGGVHLSLIHI